MASRVPFILLISAAVSCSREPVSEPRGVRDVAVFAAKAAGPAVSSAIPPYGDAGTTLDVHVKGSGFALGAEAKWLLHGVADPAHVRTNSTTFVSSTELIANITIATDAQLAFWDVQVALLGGHNGVGSEAFEVTSARILGDGITGVTGMNAQQQVIGAANGSAWIYDDALGFATLGAGGASDVDPLGTLVVGHDGSSLPAAWLRQSNNSWIAEQLSHPSGIIGGNAMAVARTPDGSAVVAGWDESLPARKSSVNVRRPLVWHRSAAGAWTGPQFYAIPPGATSAPAYDVNSLEQVIGQVDLATGIVWDSPSTYTLLDALPTRINSAGNLIVGGRNNGAALYWWRAPGQAWHTTGVALPTLAGSKCISGLARSVNDAGVIVGWSCTSTGEKRPTAWRLNLSGPVPILVSGPTLLPGLGVPSKSQPTSAVGLTDSAPYITSGSAVSSGNVIVGVRWQLPW